jgi:hypothetical protein
MTTETSHDSTQGVNPSAQTVQNTWGAKSISAVIGRPVRQTYHLLENRLVPGAGKMGALHYLSIPVFRRAVHGEAV